MEFRTKLDYSDNRQIKQRERTETTLSGGTIFGVPFSALTSGPNGSTSAQTSQYIGVSSTFSGNSATTVFTWGISNVSIVDPYISALTPSNSGLTQDVNPIFVSSSSTVIDGNTVNLTYSGVSASNLYAISMSEPTPGNYTGTVLTDFFIYSAQGLDFTGRTIWVDNTEILRTKKLIVSDNPQPGYVLTSDYEGMGTWQPVSAVTSGTTFWSASTGTNAIVVEYSDSIASGTLALGEGFRTTAIGDYSHAEGQNTTATGNSAHSEGYYSKAFGNYSHTEGYFTTAIGSQSHAEGSETTASGNSSHAEGNNTIASGVRSHAEGSATISIGNASHSEGRQTTAIGQYSHAGGNNSIASGDTSFIHSTNSIVSGNRSAVIGGSGINGSANDTVYVPDLVIDGLTSQDPIATDANGKIVAGTSDIRLKKNINSLTNALDVVKNLRGISFEYTEESNMGSGIRFGFIAQEVQEIVPDMVRLRAKGDGTLNLNYTEVIPWLVEAIKDLTNVNISNSELILETQTIAAEDNNIELNYGGNKDTAFGGGITIINGVDSNTNSEFKINSDGDWVSNNLIIAKGIVLPTYTPTSSSDIYGKNGEITIDDNYLYIKTEQGWKRSPLELF